MTEFLDRMFVDGEWRRASGGATFVVTNPVDGRVLAEVADATPADATAAVDAASAAQAAWGSTPPVERAATIRAAAALMRDRIGHLAEVLTQEQGKPLDQARGEIEYGIGFLEWFAEEGRRAYGMTIPAAAREKRITVVKQPVGVTVAITPWNFPAVQILRKLGAALAAGCTMIVKPAELTPISALEIARCFADAGLPRGVLQVVTSHDPVPVADVLMADPRVRLVSFTGSTEVGKLLMRAAADTVKQVSLELGGHAPLIVFDDADLDTAVEQTIASKMRNMGQTCVSVNRLYVHRGVVDEFVSRLVERLGTLRVGDGMHDGVAVGPLVEQAAVDKVVRHVEDARQRGAKVVLGGGPATGLFYPPTVLVDVDETMDLAREETFGPVAPVFVFDTEREVLDRANDTPFGLAAYFFTNDLNRAVRVSEGLDYGTVGVNDASISAVQAPFGGMKASGIGREGGPAGMEEFLETKYVSLGGLA
ncbi:MAG: succinate-semialdehyde dehydrogenase (NADP(+)) [Pseudonocardia sp. SCN 72-86]|nr:MAG: succinate-semialdehyde dehydrogenase (NADP(+)) [Pseudonocardia sp. SCN 72-86]